MSNATHSPTVVVASTPSPTHEATHSPTEEATSSPTEEPEVTPSPTLEDTPSPTEPDEATLSPTPCDEGNVTALAINATATPFEQATSWNGAIIFLLFLTCLAFSIARLRRMARRNREQHLGHIVDTGEDAPDDDEAGINELTRWKVSRDVAKAMSLRED